jgi:small-conductance mechanosensitive channel
MFYVLVRLFGTLLIVPLVIWIYDWLKRISSDLFFHYPDGIVAKERFSSSKMWYGFFVLSSFLAFILIGFFIVSLVWGHRMTYTELTYFLQKELFPVGNDALTGKPIQITVYSLVKVFLYIFGGILVVYVLNGFVLSRIFDPMLVGSGVQNTIMTFSRYMIFVMAFFMGLQSVGLDSLATKIGLIVAGIAYIFKEPIGDFLSYFIILVQRPVKVGDFIRMQDPHQLEGFVRFITPRSTIIRTRNSNVFIIPNTLIITRPIQNWHYAKTFSSTEDIMFVVAYDVDPYFVRSLLREVLSVHPALLKNPEPVARLNDFVSNGQQFLVRGYIPAERVIDKWEIESELRLAIVRKLSEHKITVSVPLQIRSAPQST